MDKPCGDCGSVPTNFLAGRGWTNDSGNFASARPPINSLIQIAQKEAAKLSGIPEKALTIAFNSVVLSLSAVILYLIASLVFDPRRALIPATAWITSPLTLWFINAPYSEVPFFVFFFLSAYLVISSVKSEGNRNLFVMFALGGSIGLTVMTKSVAAGLPWIFGLLVFFIDRKSTLNFRFLKVLAFAVGMSLVIAPWSGVVYLNTGEVQIFGSSKLTKNSLRNGVTFVTDLDGDREAVDVKPEIRKFAEHLHREIFAADNLASEDAKVADYIFRIIAESVKEPVIAIHFFVMKASRVWFGTYTHNGEKLILALQAFYLGLLILSIWQISSETDHLSRPYLVITLSSTAYFWFLGIVFEPLVRYMVAPMGIVFLLFSALMRNKTSISVSPS